MHVHIQTEIDAPARHVWGVLAHDFAKIAAWSSTVVRSRALAAHDLPHDVVVDQRAPIAGRQTESAFVTAREYFVAYDDDAMQFTFDALDLPFFLLRARNTTRVNATGAQTSRVTFDVDMKLWGLFALGSGLMKARFTRAMRSVHADLTRHAETTWADLAAQALPVVAKRTAGPQ